MDEDIKVNFSRPMLVLKIRETYKAPYHKNKYMTIKRDHSFSRIDLKRHIQQYTGNWSSGLYDIQYVQKEGTYMQPAIYATYCRIDVQNGKVSKIWKASPYTKRIYPCWQYFTKKRIINKEKVKSTKKVSRIVKKIKKKVAKKAIKKVKKKIVKKSHLKKKVKKEKK